MKKLAMGTVLVVTLASCGVQDNLNDSRGRGDAPVSGIDNSAKEVIQLPDRFGNVAHACDGHGHRVFVSTQTETGRQMEVIDDETCR